MLRRRGYSRVRPVEAGVLALGVAALAACTPTDGTETPLPDTVTFSEHVAPILFENCVICHRPGESAPFSLTTYQEAKKHDEQIAEVTASRFMPPWLPAPGYGEFVGRRGLDDRQIEVLRQWHAGGAPEGNPSHLPPTPEWTEGWQLGEPDLEVVSPETYMLPADGVDVFRNLILPLPVERRTYVRAIELRPGNPRVVHHAVMRVDRTYSSRLLAQEDDEPGYEGMRWAEALPPEGHFLGWTPGKMPDPGSDDLAWVIEPGSDLVVQLHMLPTGKPEPIRPRVGLHFAPGPPTRRIETVLLQARDIDIPAGAKDYVVEDSYVLPVDLRVRTVYPHAHYLGKTLEGYAVLPDGSKQWLIKIPDWDFNWQDQYHYVEPVFLPAGTTVAMRYSYDNSSDNVRNPSFPPKRVVGGLRSTDEMGTLSLEVEPTNPAEVAALEESLLRQDIEKSPDYWVTHSLLGTHLLRRGAPREALPFLRRAIELNPRHAVAYNNLGSAISALGGGAQAVQLFRRALELRPDYPDAHYNLAVELAAQNKLDEAVTHYRRALEVRPFDADTHNNLGVALSLQGRLEQAIPHYRRALEIRPDSVDAHTNLGNVLLSLGQVDEAIAHYRRALELRPDSDDVKFNLDVALKMKSASAGR